jgi:starch synthase
MDILMVAAELAPYARESQTADAVAGLSKALRQLGHRVVLALPRYPGFEAGGLLMARRLTPLVLPSGAEVTVLDGQLASGVELALFDTTGQPQGSPELATFLGQSAAALARQRLEHGKALDVLHVHDFLAALAPGFLRRAGVSIPSVLTVHDARRQGVFAEAGTSSAELPSEARTPEGGVNLLRAGFAAADLVTTVSGRYAEELAMPELAGDLASAVAGLPRPIVGVPYGVDYAIYNPATDPALESRYDAEDPSNKSRCKAAILRRFEFELDIGRPLCVAIGDLDGDNDEKLLGPALTGLLKNDVALIVAGKGSQKLVETFCANVEDYAGDLAFLESPDEMSLRRLYAASDFVLIAPGYEPCGVRQLLAQRYGALPVARAIGGLCDTVVDADAELQTGTGFLFDEADPEALRGAFARALGAYTSPLFAQLVRRAMRLDVAWDRPARRHVQLYRELVAARKNA